MEVYNSMWGPSEFTPSGSLNGYDRTGDLGRVDVPVLLLCGRHDEATPDSTVFYASLMPTARVHVFEESSHNAFIEQPDGFISVVADFLGNHWSKMTLGGQNEQLVTDLLVYALRVRFVRDDA